MKSPDPWTEGGEGAGPGLASNSLKVWTGPWNRCLGPGAEKWFEMGEIERGAVAPHQEDRVNVCARQCAHRVCARVCAKGCAHEGHVCTM